MRDSKDITQGLDPAPNHPTRETLAAYLYGEIPRPARAKLNRHLRSCPECATALAGWRRTMRTLDQDAVPSRAEPAGWAAWLRQPALQWAAAAVVLLAVGTGIGRLTAAPPADLAKLRAELKAELRRDMAADWDQASQALLNAAGKQSQELLLQYAEQHQARSLEDQQALLTNWRELDAQRAGEILALRRDLETVAVVTDASLRQTERRLVNFAQSTQPPATQ